MSILIRDMEMPDSCFHCKISEVCQYYKAEHYANKRHEDCPLEEVPETHEKRTETHACDLISRKEAIDAHYEYCNKHPDAGFPVWSLKIFEDLPSAQLEHTSNNDCNGCKFVGCYDTDFPCANCIRKNKDYYAPERRTDEHDDIFE